MKSQSFLQSIFNPMNANVLWKRIMSKGFSEKDQQSVLRDCDTLIGILERRSTTPDKARVYFTRGIYHSMGGKSQEALDDYNEAAAIYRERRDFVKMGECEEKMRNIRYSMMIRTISQDEDKKKKVQEISSLSSRLRSYPPTNYSEIESHIFKLADHLSEPEAYARFYTLKDLEYVKSSYDQKVARYRLGMDSNARQFVSERYPILTKAEEAMTSYYSSKEQREPHSAALVGRILTRRLNANPLEPLPAQITILEIGLPAAVWSCVCARCGYPNSGIPMPINGPFLPFYSEKTEKGAFCIRALCDRCGEEFYISWETDPR